MRIVCKADRKRLGACRQCGLLPDGGLPRKIVKGVDVGEKAYCKGCTKWLSEHRKAKRKQEPIESGVCSSCRRAPCRDGGKTCVACHNAVSEWNKTAFAKKRKAVHAAKPESKAKKAENAKKPERVAKKKEWHDSDRGKEMTNANFRKRYERVKNDPAWALDHKLCTLLRFTLTNSFESATIRELTEFQSPGEFLDHLKSLFTEGMTVENHGRGSASWHIGHRIPRAYYDHSDIEEVKKCWSKQNIFPQWEVDNLKAGANLPPRDELLALRAIWPKSLTA